MVNTHITRQTAIDSRTQSYIDMLEIREVFDAEVEGRQEAIEAIRQDARSEIYNVFEPNGKKSRSTVKPKKKVLVRGQYAENIKLLNGENRLNFENVEVAFDYLNLGLQMMEWAKKDQSTHFFDDNTKLTTFRKALSALDYALKKLKSQKAGDTNATQKIFDLLETYFYALNEHISVITDESLRENFNKMLIELNSAIADNIPQEKNIAKENGAAA
jgi:hypothetical protein